ncbi:MAG: dTDP-4-dehydrorhamnose reductase, partial [Candidatus Aenigmatarchaeota archaeon]
MEILITGGSGLLGEKLSEIAINKGYKVYAGYCHNIPKFGYPLKIDLTKEEDLKKIYQINPDIIIHTAALTNVDECEINKELAYKINFEGTKKINKIAKKINSFFIYISTDYVFPGEKGMYKEEDEPAPINYYGYTKFLGENYCDCVVRTCVVYGARQASGKVNFALWLINKLENQEKIKIITDQYITPTLNTNLAKMILEIAEKKLKGKFHLAGATRISRYDFALKIADKFKLNKNLIIPIKTDELNWIAKRPKDSSLDTSKASKILKEKPYK